MNERLRAVLCAARGFDAVIITDPVARRYLTGFDSDDAGALLINQEGAYFIIDSRYYEAAESLKEVKVILQKNMYEQMSDLLSGAERVAVPSAVTVEGLGRIRAGLSGFEIEACADVDRAVRSMRAVKTESEIKGIVAAQRIAERAFEHVLGYIREGVSEIEIAAELEYIMRRCGSQRTSFDTIVVSGAGSSVPHGVPTAKRVEAGDFITMDFGAVVDGCHSDMTRTVALGFASDEMVKVYDTVLLAQQAAIDSVCAGKLCSEVDGAARGVIDRRGYGEFFTHSTGHGVGLEIHESPSLSPKSDERLETGSVVTVEPGIYLSGRFGVRIEDMVLVRDGGCVDLTEAKKELIIL